MAQEVVEHGLVNVNEFWGVEIPLYFPKVYAGTTDCCGIHRGDESIIDFKQSNKEKKREWIDDYFLQLCAYGEAHNEIHGTRIRKGVIMMSVKPDLDKDGLMIGKPKYLEFVLGK
jgi:genome maintenance exonuclease 1